MLFFQNFHPFNYFNQYEYRLNPTLRSSIKLGENQDDQVCFSGNGEKIDPACSFCNQSYVEIYKNQSTSSTQNYNYSYNLYSSLLPLVHFCLVQQIPYFHPISCTEVKRVYSYSYYHHDELDLSPRIH